jgi:hypothetical protein
LQVLKRFGIAASASGPQSCPAEMLDSSAGITTNLWIIAAAPALEMEALIISSLYG